MKRRNLIIIIGAIFVAGLAAGITVTLTSVRKSKTTYVAFYDIPDEACQVITKVITKDSNEKFVFKTLTQKEYLSKRLSKKYQLLFCYNDANTKELAQKAITIPPYVQERTPSTLRSSALYTYNDETKIMPVAIDIFEAAYLETTSWKYQIPVPQNFEELGDFAHTSKFYYNVPLLIAGEVDQNINSLFTMFVQAYGGKEAYFSMIDKLKNTEDFKNIYGYKVGGLAGGKTSVADLLDKIKGWQEKEYFAYNWATMPLSQTDIMIEDNRVALSFMNLSEHRTKPMPNAKYYKMLELPCGVQPVIVGLGFKDSETVHLSMNKLSLPENQELISFETRLGPSMRQGTSYDIQADDARYYAAATESGPVPDLGTAALKTKEQRALLAQAIRDYFNK